MINQHGFLVSHPTGNTFVRALLEKLVETNLLESFHTTLGFGHDCNPFFVKLRKRRGYEIPDSKIARQWFIEIARLLRKGSQGGNRKLADLSYANLDRSTSRRLNSSSAMIIHAYEDGALASFQRAKCLGIQCSYELPIAHWSTCRRLLAEEAERYPHWEPTLESTREPDEKLLRKEEELGLADRITCPSKFVLESIPKEIRTRIPCQIAPFGSPTASFETSNAEKRPINELKVLFVGSMSQRKGLADVFEAMRLLNDKPIKLSILGQPSMPQEFYRKQFSDFDYFHPCTNSKVREIMQRHDALILPSIVEGRALVQQEALSCGLPIIVTRNAGGEDLVDEGLTGHIVPIRSPEKIAEKIVFIRESKLSKADRRIACKEKARRFSWDTYAQRIIDFNLSTRNQLFQVT